MKLMLPTIFVDLSNRAESRLMLLYQWFLVAVRKNIYPDGPTLCAQALEIAKHLQVDDFKASNGWLEKWKARHI